MSDLKVRKARITSVSQFGSKKSILNNKEKLISTLERNSIKRKHASTSEVLNVTKSIKDGLPEVYQWFLLEMGHGAGKYMAGSSVFFNELENLQEWGEELVQENDLALPDKAFVFWLHQGYRMAFFILGESDDPTVYYFAEGKEMRDFEELESLSDFLIDQLKVSGLSN